jgi:dihydropteroate synthase
MQQDTAYRHVVAEVHGFLAQRAAAAEAAGLGRDRIWLDPGIGFGKDTAGNLALLAALPDLAALGYGVVVGVSRKSFIGRLTGAEPGDRLPGSLSALAKVVGLPRAVIRVHDVAATVQFLTVALHLEGAA